MRIQTFDTTLRDGTQGEAVSFSADDKMLIAQKLDELGIDYIEGGWPGSNPKDKEFFARAQRRASCKHARLTAFGSTRFAKNTVEEDPNVQALLEAETPVGLDLRQELGSARPPRARHHRRRKSAADFGNRAYLKDHGKEVVYDAEHFFDGYNANRDFALRTLEAAKNAGADVLLPVRYQRRHAHAPARRDGLRDVRKRFDGVLGIHTHNDSDVAVANTLAAVEAGLHARAGLHQRLRRALRQRQSGLDHRQSGIEAGPHDHRQGAICKR